MRTALHHTNFSAQKVSRKIIASNEPKYLKQKQTDLSTVAPETEWIPWQFPQRSLPYGYWQDKSNHRKFFDELGKQIGIQTMNDWYTKLSRTLVIQHRGGTLLTLYNGSAIAALRAVYPEYNWVPWKFKSAAKKVWNSDDNISRFLSELSDKLSIQTLDDWYRVDWVQLVNLGAESLLRKHKGLYPLLKKQYPNYQWDPKKFSRSKKGQRSLVVVLKKLFPEEGKISQVWILKISEIIEDYMHPKVTFPKTNRPIELDVFIPSKSLAFEYQGQQHYQNVDIFGSAKIYQQRDEEKRILCAANNIKLIEVPYWWNRAQHTLQEIIDK